MSRSTKPSPYPRNPTTPWASSLRNAQIGGDVIDSQFQTTGENLTVNNADNDLVSIILWPNVAAEAIFDSAAEHAAGNCHPDTREKIIKQIVQWIKNPDPNKCITWVYGVAGAGKSELAQTICELLKASHPNDYGASFFFSGGSTDCGEASRLFATLAYQLSLHFPPIRAEINKTLDRDPRLPTKCMEIQLIQLIIRPLQRCRTLLSHSPVIIIDGLDKCADDSRGTTQANIVALLSKCVAEYKIPLRFMLLSRPEDWIRDAFATAPLPRIALPLSLRDNVDADNDDEAEPNVEVHENGRDGDTPLYQSTIEQQQSAYPWNPPTPRVSSFQNARIGGDVKDNQFNTAGGNLTINNTTRNNDLVSIVLWPNVAAGAIFDSAARHAAGKCHPGTRERIIEQILYWIKNPHPTKRISWIYGAAGAGKSALAHTICELLKELHRNEYGASFFFSGGSTDRGDASRLFATLAYQLSIHSPPIRAEINKALARDPSLPTKSMEIQMLHLIVQPLQRCRTLLSHSPVIIIDGLDECADDSRGTTQASIVALLSQCVDDYKIPLRFMISCRPEYWIRDAFATAPLPRITLPLSLRDDVDADKDIKAYLTEGFEKIRMENKHFMKSVASPWPPADIVDRFVEEASGQYIYPATVLKFIGNYSKFTDPQKQLAIITSPGPHRAAAFSQLDRLYATIVSVYPDWDTMKLVLAALLVGANTAIIKVVLGVDPDELNVVLDALSSLIEKKRRRLLDNNDGENSDDDLKQEALLECVFGSLHDEAAWSFCHRSFREFLEEEARSGPLYIDLKSNAVPNDIVTGFFDMIYRNLEQNYETEPHVFLDIDLVTHHGTMPAIATYKSTQLCSPDILLSQITCLSSKLDLYDFGRLTSMHSVFYFMREVDRILRGLDDLLHSQLTDSKSDEHDERSEKLMEFQTACQQLKLSIDRACKEALSALASSTDFEAIPTLVYLTEYQTDDLLPVNGLSTTAGVTDVISTLRRHRYVVPVWYNTVSQSWKYTPLNSRIFGDDAWPGWHTQGAWRDVRVLFASQTLKSIFTNTKDWQSYSSETVLHEINIFRGLFNNSRGILDISNKEYSHSIASNAALLGVITDLAAWIGLLEKSWWHRPSNLLLVSIICWINRQLTTQQTVIILQEYDNRLPEKMAEVLKYLLEHVFLPDLTRSYQKDLCAFAPEYMTGDRIARSIAIKVRPLPHGFYEEETTYSDWARESWNDDWHSVHDELFGKTEERSSPIIHPSHWHPHLVSRLFKLLVRFLYGQIHPEFSSQIHYYENSFPYIVQCLPYAHTTPANLDALRAIVYLFPKVTPAWNPPERFWPSLVEFLKKYDRSILSSKELDLFVTWLTSTEHADITPDAPPEDITLAPDALLKDISLDAPLESRRECSECGLPVYRAYDPEGSIRCENPGCKTHWFHQACYTIENSAKWRCEEWEQGTGEKVKEP